MKKGQKAGFLCPTGSKVILTKGKQRGTRKSEEEGRKERRKKQCLLSWFLHWSLSFETPPFSGHNICSGKNVHTISVLVTSIEGTPLFRGKGHFSWVSKPRFNLPSANNLVLKKRLTTKRVDKFHSSLAKVASEFYRISYLTKIDVLNVWQFNTQHHRHNYGIIFFWHFLDS